MQGHTAVNSEPGVRTQVSQPVGATVVPCLSGCVGMYMYTLAVCGHTDGCGHGHPGMCTCAFVCVRGVCSVGVCLLFELRFSCGRVARVCVGYSREHGELLGDPPAVLGQKGVPRGLSTERASCRVDR